MVAGRFSADQVQQSVPTRRMHACIHTCMLAVVVGRNRRRNLKTGGQDATTPLLGACLSCGALFSMIGDAYLHLLYTVSRSLRLVRVDPKGGSGTIIGKISCGTSC